MEGESGLHQVGAKPLPLPPGVISGAVFGGAGAPYRYSLEWHLPDGDQRRVMWVMMNPSVADHRSADRTVLKCWRFTRAWGYSRMVVGNSAAYRATDQKRLAEVADPAGPGNAAWLLLMAKSASVIVVAHGKPTVAAARRFGPEAVALLRKAGHSLTVLRLSPSGCPEHPLFLRETLQPQPWPGG